MHTLGATLLVREAGPAQASKPRLLDRVRQAIGTHHYSRRTEKACVHWIKRLIVFHGKGHKDRATMLPAAAKADLIVHIARVRGQHEGDLRHGAGWVELSGALLRKYPTAGREWAWQ